jgi:hypothetical protein
MMFCSKDKSFLLFFYYLKAAALLTNTSLLNNIKRISLFNANFIPFCNNFTYDHRKLLDK